MRNSDKSQINSSMSGTSTSIVKLGITHGHMTQTTWKDQTYFLSSCCSIQSRSITNMSLKIQIWIHFSKWIYNSIIIQSQSNNYYNFLTTPNKFETLVCRSKYFSINSQLNNQTFFWNNIEQNSLAFLVES